MAATNKKTCYMLEASGISATFNNIFSAMSKTIYTDRADAERAMSDFAEACHDESYLNYAVRGTVKVKIREFELC